MRVLGILFATLILAVFNNCSSANAPMRSFRYDKTNFSGYNGGGHSGKVSYSFNAAEPLCGGNLKAEGIIEIMDGQARLTENTCSGTTTRTLAQSELSQNPYNPYYMIQGERVFVHESITKDIPANYRVTVDSLCTNPDFVSNAMGTRGLDFAIRYEKTYINGVASNWVQVGHAVFGSQSGATALSKEIRGRAADPGPNSSHGDWRASDNSYSMTFLTEDSPTRGTGVLTIETGESVPVNCHFLVVRVPDPPSGS